MKTNATKRIGKNLKKTHSLEGICKKSYNYFKKISSTKMELMRRSYATDDIQLHYSQNKTELLRPSLGIAVKKRSSSEPPMESKPMDYINEETYYSPINNPQFVELDCSFKNMEISNE